MDLNYYYFHIILIFIMFVFISKLYRPLFNTQRLFKPRFEDVEESNCFKEHAIKILFHEEKLFMFRVNIVLVFQSLLLISFVTSLAIDIAIENKIHIIISFGGFLISIFFSYVNIRSCRNIERLKFAIEDALPFYKKLRLSQNPSGRELPTNMALAYILSIGFGYVWMTLLFFHSIWIL